MSDNLASEEDRRTELMSLFLFVLMNLNAGDFTNRRLKIKVGCDMIKMLN